MLWVPLNMGMSAAHCQGNVREFQSVWRVVTLYILRWFTHLTTVTHSHTHRSRHKVTSLIITTAVHRTLKYSTLSSDWWSVVFQCDWCCRLSHRNAFLIRLSSQSLLIMLPMLESSCLKCWSCGTQSTRPVRRSGLLTYLLQQIAGIPPVLSHFAKYVIIADIILF